MSPKAESSGLIFLRSYLRKLAILLLVAAFFTSCHQKSGPPAQEQVNLAWLGHMYGMYISQNKGETPKSIEDLRKFVEKSTNAERLSRLHVANASELFVSPRDGKPFTMVSYDKPPAIKYGQPAPVVLYEVEGQNGQRAVAFLGGGTKSVDENELQKILPAKAKLPHRG